MRDATPSWDDEVAAVNMIALPGIDDPRWWGAETRAINPPWPIRQHHHPEHHSKPVFDYFDGQLTQQVRSLADAERFLLSCDYADDEDTHGHPDYWCHPIEFEQIRVGDCEDHALWAWRTLHDAGYDVRLMIGIAQEHGHAWVCIYRNDRCYVLETTHKTPFHRPPIEVYEPHWSFERTDDGRIRAYMHCDDYMAFADTLYQPREVTPSQWGSIDPLIFTGRKNEAIRMIRDVMGPSSDATREFLSRYEHLRANSPTRFELDDETYWADWQ